MLNCATSSTIGTRSKPIDSRWAASGSRRWTPPLRSSTRNSRNARGIRVRSNSARAVVISTWISPRVRRSSVSTRSPAISMCGSASPNPSRGGYRAIGVSSTSVPRSASQRSASVTLSVATTKKRVVRRRANAARTEASADPGNPPIVRRSPGAGMVLYRRTNAGRRSIASSKGASAMPSRSSRR